MIALPHPASRTRPIEQAHLAELTIWGSRGSDVGGPRQGGVRIIDLACYALPAVRPRPASPGRTDVAMPDRERGRMIERMCSAIAAAPPRLAEPTRSAPSERDGA
jgi:hypothetical protein